MTRLLLAIGAFALIAPRGIAALPTAILGLGRPSRGGGPAIVAGALLGLGAAWLVWPADLPGRTVRAAALFAAVAFAVLSDRTRWSVTHRALAAVGLALTGTATLYVLLGLSWAQLVWWVEYQTGFSLHVASGLMVQLGLTTFDAAGLNRVVRWTAQTFPAMTALQLLIGLGLAGALHTRLAARPRGTPPAPVASFRFTEHLGWILVLGVVGLLAAPEGSAARIGSLNLLLFGGALYLARGLAVAVFLWARAGRAAWMAVLGAIAILFLWPVVLTAGVLDAGLDLRRRFAAPPTTE